MSDADDLAPQRLAPEVETAIQWSLRLGEGKLQDWETRAFEAWLAADPSHRNAWDRLGRGLAESVGRIEPLLSGACGSLRQTLVKPGVARRRFLRSALALGAVGVGTASLLDRHMPLRNLMADIGTDTAQRGSHVLPDGSRMMLDARSRVDLDFSGQYRFVRLLAGALHVDVVPDARRPFLVQTAQGRVQTLGLHTAGLLEQDQPMPAARFMVRQEEGGTLLVVQQHAVHAGNLAGQDRRVHAGMGLRFASDSMGQESDSLASLAAWTQGKLEAYDWSLGAVIEALQPYYAGVLRVSPQAARLRVSGLFPLDDPWRTLQALENVLPVRVRRYTPWMTLIDVISA